MFVLQFDTLKLWDLGLWGDQTTEFMETGFLPYEE
jgi:hypothetical protein